MIARTIFSLLVLLCACDQSHLGERVPTPDLEQAELDGLDRLGAFTIPDKAEGESNIQSILFQEDIDILAAGISATDAVLSGLAVTGGSDMTPAVAKGSALSNSALCAIAAADVTVSAADGTHPRLDLIVVNSSCALAVRAGTAAAAPKPPARTANDVVIAQVYVPASDTTIGSAQLIDRRVFAGPTAVLKKTTTAVTFNTTSSIQTYFTLTVPNGLFLAGKTIRVRAGGSFLSNSGTPTWTLAIAYGGTTMFADPTPVTGADTDRRAWYLDFDITAQANNDQALAGLLLMGDAVTATTGLGNLGAVTPLAATAFSGSAAVDSDAANRDLIVQWTMSVSNAAVETTMDYATAELL